MLRSLYPFQASPTVNTLGKVWHICQNPEINIDTILITKLQTFFGVHWFSHQGCSSGYHMASVYSWMLLSLLQPTSYSVSHDLDTRKGTAWLFCRLSLKVGLSDVLVIRFEAMEGQHRGDSALPHWGVHEVRKQYWWCSFIGLRWWLLGFPTVKLPLSNLHTLSLDVNRYV